MTRKAAQPEIRALEALGKDRGRFNGDGVYVSANGVMHVRFELFEGMDHFDRARMFAWVDGYAEGLAEGLKATARREARSSAKIEV